MIRILDYTDETREAIMAEQKALGFTFIEDQRHFDGNHLIFNDGKPPRDLAKEIDDLKAQLNDFDARLKKDIGGYIR